MSTSETQEISLKDLFVRSKKGLRFLKTKWKLILLCSVIGGILGFVYAHFSKPKYAATLTFVLASEGQEGALTSLAGQFGLDFGNNSDGAFSGDNIVALLESQRMIKSALFKKIPGKNECLANLIIDKAGFLKSWSQNVHLKNQLPFPCDANKLTPVQDSLVSELHDYITENYLLIDKVDKKLSYYKVVTTSPDENISVYLTDFLVEESSRFYIDTKTQTAKQNLSMLQHEADSLRRILGGSISATAEAADRTFNLNPAYQIERSPAQESQIRVTVLGTAYGEVVKNLELAKISLQKDTPLYQVIDTPELPLKQKKASSLLFLIAGFVLFGLMIGVLLILIKLLRE